MVIYPKTSNDPTRPTATYPSRKSTLTFPSHLGQNCNLGVGGQLRKNFN